jgi:hypothetical protein
MNTKLPHINPHTGRLLFNRSTGGTRKTNRVFRVELTIPPDATEDDVMDYIEDAVQCWKGSYHPDHPMFDLDPDTVVCKRAKS